MAASALKRAGPAATLVARLGGRYATALGIALEQRDSGEIFKWFLASLLYGARITQSIAGRTYREFQRSGVTSPARILETGWNGLVEILDRGGYVRYDFKTATKLLAVCGVLVEKYGGDLNAVHDAATSTEDLAARLRALGKGIGAVTVNIFLRELRGIWRTAEPPPSDRVLAAAADLAFLPRGMSDAGGALDTLRRCWRKEGMKAGDFADFEAALLRHARALRKRASRPRSRSPPHRPRSRGR
ncbi:MAG TPA: hypothetical protein VMV91_06035 [Rhodocyclaceae bacterium]|nr:hypothetical protein [Rhodocyclaceae bacterium]